MAKIARREDAIPQHRLPEDHDAFVAGPLDVTDPAPEGVGQMPRVSIRGKAAGMNRWPNGGGEVRRIFGIVDQAAPEHREPERGRRGRLIAA